MSGLLATCRLTAFIATRNIVRAKIFYGNTLGLPLVSDGPFAVVFNAGGVMLRVTPVQELNPAPYSVLGWEVPDMNAAIANLESYGVVFERFPGVPQNHLGVWTAPDGAKVAWFKDPDENIIGISQQP